jgi:hypothetical protein
MSLPDVPTLAGLVSTVIFAGSTLPMLSKAYRSRDLMSYSLGNILLANVGNVVHSVYVFSLPPGPLWALHVFYLVSTGLMLGWYLRYAVRRPPQRLPEEMRRSPDAAPATALLAFRDPSQEASPHDRATRGNPDHRRRPGRPHHRLPPQAARPTVPDRGRQPPRR